MKKNNNLSRRDFINRSVRVSAFIGLGGLGAILFKNNVSGETIWQLDASKCIQCGRCATDCVLAQSAVKCMHVYDMCGYCDLCGGYFRTEVKDLTTAAENQLCPTRAIERKFVEEPFFEYKIDEKLCIACGKCVAGCGAFGNGSLQLQVNPDICTNCNQCSIAKNCPTDSFQKVPVNKPYKFSK
ncbi:MAG: ferredoxin [Bacteroidetes bacterium]|jgi:Na+-translocating ferredoxin:NAD+ oxidoreductase subunit B|nr:ferredoxin [Bacteroidota bacterium]MBT6685197.1 ferredoxin [Bacteroidota bacterium]MBT7143454.1 ferredoxin [Bacteroidota bacterium]MBT7492050.1 ferredoxin [Bacteroidota bacterium]